MSEESERLTVLAHELRSPVAALVALGHAWHGLPTADDRRRAIELAVAAARDIERLVRDPALLSLDRAEVDLAALVEGLAGDVVAVRVEGRPSVLGDATRLRQAMANLVANGLRHGSRVAVSVAEHEGEVVLEVADDGPGVGPLEDPFARGSSSVASTGLGLWLARAIAEAHGGTLELVPGAHGARFRLALPSSSGAS